MWAFGGLQQNVGIIDIKKIIAHLKTKADDLNYRRFSRTSDDGLLKLHQIPQ